MITVEHAPGGSSAIHRHNAHAFVYVLEGSVVIQLKGRQQVTLTPCAASSLRCTTVRRSCSGTCAVAAAISACHRRLH
jgi:Cupin domain